MSGENGTGNGAVLDGELVPEDAAASLRNNPYLPDGENGENGTQRRVSKWTAPLKRRFLRAIAEGASTSKAANALEMSRSGVYYQRSVDPDFAAAWEEALELAADLYEDRLHDMALDSRHPAPVIFQLKNRRPDKWRDQHEIKTTVEHHHTFSVQELSPERQRALAELALKTLPAPEGDVVDGELVEPKQPPVPAPKEGEDA